MKFLIIFLVIKIIINYFFLKKDNLGGPLAHVAARTILSGPQNFFTLLKELKALIGMGGKMF